MARTFLIPARRAWLGRWPWLRYPIWFIEASLLWLFWQMSACLTPDMASRFGRCLLQWLGPQLAKQRHVKNNLRVAFADKTPAEIAELAKQMWGGVGAVLAEYPHLKTIVHPRDGSRIETIVIAPEHLPPHSKKPAIFVTAHIANWELCPVVAALQLGIKVTVAYSRQQNPWVDRLLQSYRQTLGYTLLANAAGLRPLVRELQQGRSIGLVVDQRFDEGVPIPFFGVSTPTVLTPARLAIKWHYNLIPVQVERLEKNRAYFRVTFHSPIKVPDDYECADEYAKAMQMTQQLNTLFEQWIRQQPDEWLCVKRRWPKATNTHIESNKPSLTEGISICK